MLDLPKTYKKSSSPEQLDRSRGNFMQMFPKPWVYKFVEEQFIGHMVWQPYWIEGIYIYIYVFYKLILNHCINPCATSKLLV